MNNKKHLIGGLNTDDAEVLMNPKEYVGALNVRFVTSENGAVGRITNIEGNVNKNTTTDTVGNVVAFTLPSGTNTVIGSWEDAANSRVYFFVKNNTVANGSYSHAIYCYDSKTDLIYTVIKDSQIAEGLKFDKYISSIDCLGSTLTWTDNLRDPKSINADAAIKGNHPMYVYDYAYTFPIPYTSSTVIKRPPIYTLQVEKTTDSAFLNNYLKSNAYKFMYQYTYIDGQVSALSAQSDLIPFSILTQTANAVRVTIPSKEKIPDDVQYIDIIVKYDDETIASVVKTFDRAKTPSVFTNHNAGTTSLQFMFYNNEIGATLDEIQSINSFDAVPLLSKTLTFAKNRLFLGNNTTGYTTPPSNDISVTLGQSQLVVLGDVTGIVKSQNISIRNRYDTMLSTAIFYYVFVDGHSPSIYLFDRYKDYSPGSWPSTLNAADATATLFEENTQLVNWITSHYEPGNLGVGYNYYWEPQYYYDSNYTYRTAYSKNVTIHVDASSTPDQVYYKSGASYKLSISFYDRYRRKCGVVDTSTNSTAKITIPDRTRGQISFYNQINWTLSSTNRLTEIPDWAYYYQIHRTKNLSTRFFLQDYSAGFCYTIKTDTGYDHTTATTFDQNKTYAISLDLGRANSSGRGYSYQEGDMCRVIDKNDSVHIFTIIGVDAGKVMLSPVDFGTTYTDHNIYFEIYTPYKPSTTEPFYEVGPVMDILNPGTTNRDYSIKTGQLPGDTYAVGVNYNATSYVIETMCQNNNYWKIWATPYGWSNIVTRLGRTIKKNSVQFSNVIIPGTKTNGLNSFEALNETELPIELNGVNRLVLTSKVQAEGTIMLAIGTNETASLYLGESQIFDATGDSFIAKATGVIGQVNVLRGSYGTMNPESAFGWQGFVYWFDARKGAVVRYDVNGLFPISDYKMRKFFAKIGQYVLSTGATVLMGIDPFNKEVLISLPATTNNAINEQLSDMALSSTSYNFTTTITPVTVNITNVEQGSPFVDVDLYVNGVYYFGGGAGSTSITVNHGDTVTVGVNTGRVDAAPAYITLSVSDGTNSVYNHTTRFDTTFSNNYQIVDSCAFTVIAGNTYSITTSSRT